MNQKFDRNKSGKYPKRKPLENPAVEKEDPQEDTGLLYGRNAVLEALKSGRTLDKLFVQLGEREGSITLIVAKAKEAGISVVQVEKVKLDSMSGGGVHQGVVAMVAGVEYRTVDELLAVAEEKGEAPFLVIADGVEDPHNLGAIIRCAEGAGAHGLIISKRHSAPVTPVVVKSSAGAIHHLPIAKVVNIASTIDDLKKKGVWIYGAEADGVSLYESDLSGAAAFVVGSEGNGISRLVKEKCDFLLSIPMYGNVNSFNVSCATAVVLCRAAQCRHAKK
ncbi:MAG: 23S rRNA (guanosine(2251)-2'-O)-methyltransferase RlmB [Clostridia bacterium]|nr:23S rRNA (guanosine(2251)-2'-O)-methyltransferase RlmB [Clostridia bacterium]